MLVPYSYNYNVFAYSFTIGLAACVGLVYRPFKPIIDRFSAESLTNRAIDKILNCPSTKAYWISAKADEAIFIVANLKDSKLINLKEKHVVIPNNLSYFLNPAAAESLATYILGQLYFANERDFELSKPVCFYSEAEFADRAFELEEQVWEKVHQLILPCVEQNFWSSKNNFFQNYFNYDYQVTRMTNAKSILKNFWQKECRSNSFVN